MGKLAKLAGDSMGSGGFTDKQMLILLLHSILLGMILVVATFYEVKTLSRYPGAEGSAEGDDDDDSSESGSPEKLAPPDKKKSGVDNLEIFLGAANLLFLCVGLTGVMLLVNNSLARAFAIAAALALTRFRIKLDQKSVNASLLFAILVGMACGLGQERLAYMTTGIYIVLFLILLITVRLIKPKRTA